MTSRKPARKRTKPVAAKRKALVQRLWSAAEAQIADIETRFAALGGDGASFERDARALGLLAKFLKELVSIECLMNETAAPAKSSLQVAEDDHDAPRSLDEFRRELAQRLDQLRGARELERSFDQSEPDGIGEAG